MTQNPTLQDSLRQEASSDDFLTDDQLAILLGVSTRTTLRWRRDGDGPPYVRAGLRRVLYSRAAVNAWAARRTFPTLAAEAAISRVAT